jgi:hypothetical protein
MQKFRRKIMRPGNHRRNKLVALLLCCLLIVTTLIQGSGHSTLAELVEQEISSEDTTEQSVSETEAVTTEASGETTEITTENVTEQSSAVVEDTDITTEPNTEETESTEAAVTEIESTEISTESTETASTDIESTELSTESTEQVTTELITTETTITSNAANTTELTTTEATTEAAGDKELALDDEDISPEGANASADTEEFSKIFLKIKLVDASNTSKLLKGAVITATEKYYDAAKGWTNTGYVFTETTNDSDPITNLDFTVSGSAISGQAREKPVISPNYLYEIAETVAPDNYMKKAQACTAIYLYGDSVDKKTLPEGTEIVEDGTVIVLVDAAYNSLDTGYINQLTIKSEYYNNVTDKEKVVDAPASGAEIEVYYGYHDYNDCSEGKCTPISPNGDLGNNFNYVKISDNESVLSNIPLGEYTIYETAPAGYETQGRVYHFEVANKNDIDYQNYIFWGNGAYSNGKEQYSQTADKKQTTKIIENYQVPTTEFKINKEYKGYNDTTLTGNDIPEKAVFTYTQQSVISVIDGTETDIDASAQKAVELAASDDGLTYTAGNLTPGKYYIKENESSLYEKADDISFIVNENGEITSVTRFHYKLSKTDTADETPINTNNPDEYPVTITNKLVSNSFTISKSYYKYDENNQLQKMHVKGDDDGKLVEEQNQAEFTVYYKKNINDTDYSGVYKEDEIKNVLCKDYGYTKDFIGGGATLRYINLVPGYYKVVESLKENADVEYEQLYTVEFTVNDDYTITTPTSQNAEYDKTVEIKNVEKSDDTTGASFYLKKYVSDYSGNLTVVSKYDVTVGDYTAVYDDSYYYDNDGNLVDNFAAYNPDTDENEGKAENAYNYVFTITSDTVDEFKAGKQLKYDETAQHWYIEDLQPGEYTITESSRTAYNTSAKKYIPVIKHLQMAEPITIKVENVDGTNKITSVKYNNTEYSGTSKNPDFWTDASLPDNGNEKVFANLVNRPLENSITINKLYVMEKWPNSEYFSYNFKDGGSVFTLHGNYGLTTVSPVRDKDGNYIFKNIEPGRYTISETDQPEGFDAVEDIDIWVTKEYAILFKYDYTKNTKAPYVRHTYPGVSQEPGGLELDCDLTAYDIINNSFTFTKKYTLSGKEFSEEKYTKNTHFIIAEEDEEDNKVIHKTGNTKNVTIEGDDEGNWTPTTGTDGDEWTLKNLSDGTYYIHETKTPDGYAPAADIKLVVDKGLITASYVTCPNESSRTPTASDFTNLTGNGTTDASAILYNRYKNSNTLTIKKKYFDADGNEIPYSKIGSSAASFELHTSPKYDIVIPVSYVDLSTGTYVYENIAPTINGYTLVEKVTDGYKPFKYTNFEALEINVDFDGKIVCNIEESGMDDKPKWYNIGDASSKNLKIGIDNQLYENSFTINKEYYSNNGTETNPTNKAKFVVMDSDGNTTEMTQTDDSYTIKNLDPGKYTVVETVPVGYKQPDGAMTLTVEENRKITASYEGTSSDFSTTSENDGRDITATFKNHEAENSISIVKSYTDANGKDISVAELTSAEYPSFGIYDAATDTEVMNIDYRHDDKNGKYQFNNIPVGEYYIRETAGGAYTTVPDIRFSVTTSGITVTENDKAKKDTKASNENNIVLNVTNKRKPMENSIILYKKFHDVDGSDVTDDTLLDDTEFVMTDKAGNTVTGFDRDTHNGVSCWKVKNLEPGTYRITEKTTPDGYVKADDLTLTVTRTTSGTDTNVVVRYHGEEPDCTETGNGTKEVSITLTNHEDVDNTLNVSKNFFDTYKRAITNQTDIDGYMENTSFTLTRLDDANTVIAPNDRSGTKYVWKKLQVGKYTLSESSHDSSFSAAADITVTVNEDGTIDCTGDGSYFKAEKAAGHTTNLSVYNYDKDSELLISKTDISGTEELEGARLKIYEEANPTKVVDEWTSKESKHMIEKEEFTKDVIYALEETTAPFGYEIAEKILFKLDENGDVCLVDESGNTIGKDENTITMKDDYSYMKVMKISDKDLFNPTPLAGAKLEITDENGIIEQWTSDDSAHEIQIGGSLKPNEIYTLSETSAPYGYEKAEVQFKLTDDEKVMLYDAEDDKYVECKDNIILAVDKTKKLYISKKDITNGEELPGATIKITDADGNEITSWVSSTTPHTEDLSKFEPDKEYTLTEITAPEGYDVAESIVFKTDSDGKIYVKDSNGIFEKDLSDKIVMQDKPTGTSAGKLLITKTIKGDVTEEEAEGALKFTVTDNSTSVSLTYTLKDFDYDETDDIYTLELLEVIDGYTVEETVTDIDGYVLKSVTYSVDGENPVDGDSVDVNISAGEEKTVAFEDAYGKPAQKTPKTPDDTPTPDDTSTSEDTNTPKDTSTSENTPKDTTTPKDNTNDTTEDDTSTSEKITTEITTKTTTKITTTETVPGTPSTSTSTNVKTGDNVPLKLVIVLLMVSLLSFTGMIVYRKLNKKNK